MGEINDEMRSMNNSIEMYKSGMKEIIDRESIEPKIVLILVILGLVWLMTLTAIIVIFFYVFGKKETILGQRKRGKGYMSTINLIKGDTLLQVQNSK